MFGRIGVIAGSLRTGSVNLALARLFAATLKDLGRDVWLAGPPDLDLPIYHGDLEAKAYPPRAHALKDRIAGCGALVLVTPEYNGSLSPLLKNALDWASRPADEQPPAMASAFRGKAVVLASATPGPGAGIRALAHLRQIAQTMQMITLPMEVRVGGAFGVLGGETPDPALAAQVRTACEQLVDLARRLGR